MKAQDNNLAPRDFFEEEVLPSLKRITMDERNAFLSFIPLSAFICVLGKILNEDEKWETTGTDRTNFNKAIREFPSLQRYSALNKPKSPLYDRFRCALIHRFQDDNALLLSPGKNDLDNKIIGCQELYEDIERAWEKLKTMPQYDSKKMTSGLVQVMGNLTGTTQNISIMN